VVIDYILLELSRPTKEGLIISFKLHFNGRKIQSEIVRNRNKIKAIKYNIYKQQATESEKVTSSLIYL